MKCDLCERELSEVHITKDSSLCEDCNKTIFEQKAGQNEHIAHNTDTCVLKAERWWMASVLSLVGFICLGIIIAFMLPHNQSDWLGIRYLAVIGISILVGALLCLIFAIVSLVKREKKSLWALGTAIPSFIILFFCFSFVMNEQRKHKNHEAWTSRYKMYKQQIMKNPEIALKEHWDRSQDAAKQTVFRESFADPSINYNIQLLKQIYDEAPAMRDYVFLHRAANKEFIEAHFDEAVKRCEKINYSMLASMMKNPSTPIELVEKISKSKNLVTGAVEPAKYALEKRKPNKPQVPGGPGLDK